MKRYLILMAVAVMTAVAALAQTPKPIEWRMTARMTSETEGVLTIKAIVAPGWHLYSTSLPENAGPKPTKIEISHPASLTWTSNMTPSVAPMEKEDAVFEVKLSWWEESVTFTRKFTTTNPAAPGKIDAKITFMGCNDETCTPPSTVTLSRTVNPYKK